MIIRYFLYILIISFTILFSLPRETTASHKHQLFVKPKREKQLHLSSKKYTEFKKIRILDTQPIEIIAQLWNDTTSKWENFYKKAYKYNQIDNPTELILSVLTLSGVWLDTLKETYSYNSDNLPTQIYAVIWIEDSSAFIDFEKTIYTYDPTEGYLTEFLKQDNLLLKDILTLLGPGLHDVEKLTSIYNAEGKVYHDVHQVIDLVNAPYNLINDSRRTYTYGNELLSTVILELWDIDWAHSGKFNFTYDVKGNNTEELIQIWEIDKWVNYYRYCYTYDSSDSLTQDILQMWEENGWVNEDQFLYEYGPDGITRALYQTWENGNWLNGDQSLYEYGTNGKLSGLLHQIWETDWVNDYKRTVTYNNDDLLSEEKYEIYDNGLWIPFDRYLYTYPTAIGDKFSKKTSFDKPKLLPVINSQKNIAIQFAISQPSKVSLNIYDLKGNLIIRLVNDRKMDKGINRIVWDKTNTRGLPVASGTYFCQLKTDNILKAKHILVIR